MGVWELVDGSIIASRGIPGGATTHCEFRRDIAVSRRDISKAPSRSWSTYIVRKISFLSSQVRKSPKARRGSASRRRSKNSFAASALSMERLEDRWMLAADPILYVM